MFKIFVLFLFVTVIRGASIGEDDFEVALPRMAGGVGTVTGEFPSLVSIRTPAPVGHCGGVIVNENHVITSCQCIHDAANRLINPFWLQVIAGDLNIIIPSYRRFSTNVTHIFAHPQYNPLTRNNDIAVLRMGARFPFPHNTIDLAMRNTRVLPNGAACTFAGWGVTSTAANAQLSATQLSLSAPIIDRTACNAANVHSGLVLEAMLCAGSINATVPVSGFCNGNIGSGLFCNNEVTGLLSFGTSCGGVPHRPGVFTQTRFFNAWIVVQFNRTDNPLPGVQL